MGCSDLRSACSELRISSDALKCGLGALNCDLGAPETRNIQLVLPFINIGFIDENNEFAPEILIYTDKIRDIFTLKGIYNLIKK